ncbi:MAG: hypothetical protein V4591_02405 [Bdellovibrionota bacterium]
MSKEIKLGKYEDRDATLMAKDFVKGLPIHGEVTINCGRIQIKAIFDKGVLTKTTGGTYCLSDKIITIEHERVISENDKQFFTENGKMVNPALLQDLLSPTGKGSIVFFNPPNMTKTTMKYEGKIKNGLPYGEGRLEIFASTSFCGLRSTEACEYEGSFLGTTECIGGKVNAPVRQAGIWDIKTVTKKGDLKDLGKSEYFRARFEEILQSGVKGDSEDGLQLSHKDAFERDYGRSDNIFVKVGDTSTLITNIVNEDGKLVDSYNVTLEELEKKIIPILINQKYRTVVTFQFTVALVENYYHFKDFSNLSKFTFEIPTQASNSKEPHVIATLNYENEKENASVLIKYKITFQTSFVGFSFSKGNEFGVSKIELLEISAKNAEIVDKPDDY